MTKKIFISILIFIFIIPCLFIFTSCGNKNNEPLYPIRVTNVEADSVTNYWIEYNQGYTTHPLRTVAKATKDNITYYYLEYGNNGNWNYKFIKLDSNGHYKVWNWDYYGNTWVAINDETHPERGEGDDWFMWKTQFYSDYFSMALVQLQYNGEVDSYTRYENGTQVTDCGLSDWTTKGEPYPNYLNEELSVQPEVIHDCLHFYDEQEDRHYYFAPETHFLLEYSQVSLGYWCTTKVYKRSFDMNIVLSVHNMNNNGLPFELPIV